MRGHAEPTWKREAAVLAVKYGFEVPDVARRLEVSVHTLRRWFERFGLRLDGRRDSLGVVHLNDLEARGVMRARGGKGKGRMPDPNDNLDSTFEEIVRKAKTKYGPKHRYTSMARSDDPKAARVRWLKKVHAEAKAKLRVRSQGFGPLQEHLGHAYWEARAERESLES